MYETPHRAPERTTANRRRDEQVALGEASMLLLEGICEQQWPALPREAVATVAQTRVHQIKQQSFWLSPPTKSC